PGKLTPKPLGRESNRSQWVLYFMCDPAGYLAPGFHPLDFGYLTHVLKNQHCAEIWPIARLAVFIEPAGCKHQFGLCPANFNLQNAAGFTRAQGAGENFIERSTQPRSQAFAILAAECVNCMQSQHLFSTWVY